MSRARAFVLGQLPSTADRDAAELLTSEAATNAVVHTRSGQGGKFTVTVTRTGRTVRVAVTDSGAATTPQARPRDDSRPNGRGIDLIRTLAQKWGYEEGAEGTVVWFDVPLAT